MTDWRSEPPDSPGWWLWREQCAERPRADDRPYVARANLSPAGRVTVNTPGFPVSCGKYAPTFGQWLKVPE